MDVDSKAYTAIRQEAATRGFKLTKELDCKLARELHAIKTPWRDSDALRSKTAEQLLVKSSLLNPNQTTLRLTDSLVQTHFIRSLSRRQREASTAAALELDLYSGGLWTFYHIKTIGWYGEESSYSPTKSLWTLTGVTIRLEAAELTAEQRAALAAAEL